MRILPALILIGAAVATGTTVCGQSFGGAVSSVVSIVPSWPDPSGTVVPSIAIVPGVQPSGDDSTGTPSGTVPSLIVTSVILDSSWDATTNVLDITHLRPTSFPARLCNVSLRGYVSTDSTLIGGAVVTGSARLPAFVRAVGPGLAKLGVTSPLQYPSITVYEGSNEAAMTNRAQSGVAPVAAYVGAFPSTMNTTLVAGPSDAALAGKAKAGNLTAVCTGDGASSGTALVEFYDASSTVSAASSRFLNFSGRGRLSDANDVMVLGFVVAGDGDITLLLRGVGPSLAGLGVSDGIPDPTIELYAANTQIAASDNWQAEANGSNTLPQTATAIGAFQLGSPKEAALLVTLKAGNYTLQLRDAGGHAGTALAEIYQVSKPE